MKPKTSSKIDFERAADKATRHPSGSWWTAQSRDEFNANLQRELPRLQAIGASVPKSLRPANEAA